MTTNAERLFRCFFQAKEVLQNYWLHTDGDYPEVDRIRIENMERVTEMMTGLTITKCIVPFPGRLIRGMSERFEGYANIYVRKDQPIEWQKYTAMKEYSHLLYDIEAEDFETNPIKALSDLTSDNPFEIDGSTSAPLISERIAETLARELIYPLEWREPDKEFLDAGGALSALVARRHVPAVHIERLVTPEAIAAARGIWGLINEHQDEDSE